MATPTAEAISHLRENPDLADAFEEKFGEGAADEFVEPDATVDVEGDRGAFEDIAKSIGGGFLGAIENTGDFVAEGLDALDIPVSMNINIGPGAPNKDPDAPLIEFLSASEFNAQGGDAVFGKMGTDDNVAGPSQTVAGGIARGMTQFLTDFLGAGKLIKGAKLLQGTTLGTALVRAAVSGAAADFLAFNPQEDRLSNMLVDFPVLGPAVFEYLAADGNDSNLEGRFKNAVEGLGLGLAMEGVMRGFMPALRAIKKARRAINEGKGEAASHKILAEGADEVSEQLKFFDEDGLPTEEALRTIEARAPVSNRSLVDVDAIMARIPKGKVTFDAGLDEAPTPFFNWDKYEGPDSAKVMMKAVSEQIDARVDKLIGSGVETLETVRLNAAAELAETLNTSSLDIIAKTARVAKTAKEQTSVMIAGKLQLQAMGKDAFHAAQKAKHSGDPLDKALTQKIVNAMGDLTANLKAIQKGAARTTSAGRISIEQIILTGGDPKAIRRLTSTWAKFIGIQNEFWINAILSGPKTHIVNMTSNAIQMALLPAERIVGGVITGDLATVRQGFKVYQGYKRAFTDSTQMAWKALKTGDNVLDPYHSPIDSPRYQIDSTADSGLGSLIRGLGGAVRIPTRFLMAEDEWFKQMTFRGNLYADLSMDAANRGFNGRKLAQFIEDGFDKAIDKAGRGLDDASLAKAREATFTTNLEAGTLGGDFSTFVIKHPGLRFIAPFIRTPTNIFRAVVARTPIAQHFQKAWKADFRAGGQRRASAVGRMMTGYSLYGTATYAASQGRITGFGPSDQGERKRLFATGWRPYSFVYRDGDGITQYVSFRRLDPIGMILGLAADGFYGAQKFDEVSWLEFGEIVGQGLAQNLTSKTYLTGLTEVANALTQPDRFLEKFIKNRAASYVPTGIKQISDFAIAAGTGFTGEQPIMRESRDAMDAMLAKIPGLSSSLPPKREFVTGEPQELDSIINPFSTSSRTTSPVLNELSRLGISFQDIPEAMGTIPLTPQQQDRLAVLTAKPSGGRKTMHDRMLEEMKSDRYRASLDPIKGLENDNFKVATLKRIAEGYRAQGWKLLREEDRSLQRAYLLERAQRNASRANDGTLLDRLGKQIQQGR